MVMTDKLHVLDSNEPAPSHAPLSDAPPTAPHAFAAEQALLGGLLMNNGPWNEMEGQLKVEDFYDKRHEAIFEVLQKMLSEKHADPILLVQELKNADRLREAGGEEYIYDIAGIGAASVNIPGYAVHIKKAAMLRRMLKVLEQTSVHILHPGDASPREILDAAEARLFEISTDFDSRGGGMHSVAEKARMFFNNLTEIVNKGEFDRLLGVQTGVPKLDRMTTGLHGGDLVIVAGRPGAGKTAFALNLIRHVSADGGGVAVFSLEMSSEQLVMRLISQEKIDMQELRTGKDRQGRKMSSGNLMMLSGAVDHLEKRQIHIDDNGSVNLLEINSRCRQLAKRLQKQKKKLSMVVVDYLQLLSSGEGDGRETRAQEVGVISRGLKALAKELNVPIVACAQLNRAAAGRNGESRTNREPQLSDLRESGSIEQDADIVLFLYEEKSEEQDDVAPPEGVPVWLVVGKQRNGPVGRVQMQFQKQFSRFAEMAAGAADSNASPHDFSG